MTHVIACRSGMLVVWLALYRLEPGMRTPTRDSMQCGWIQNPKKVASSTSTFRESSTI